MKIQEVLDILSLQELPAPAPQGKGKCAALVQRVTGQKDYVITKNGGVIIDIGYRCSIVKILEYYPVPPDVKEKPTPVEESVLKQTLNITLPNQKEPEKNVKSTKYNRTDAIAFLEKQNLNKTSLLRKSDKQLQELMDGFK